MRTHDDNGIRIVNSNGDCQECDGSGEIDSGRDFPPTMRCEACRGTGYVWTAEDEQARSCDLLRAEMGCERWLLLERILKEATRLIMSLQLARSE